MALDPKDARAFNAGLKAQADAFASFGLGAASLAETLKLMAETMTKAVKGMQFKVVKNRNPIADGQYLWSADLAAGDPQEMDRTKSALERAQELQGPGRALRVFEGERPEPRTRAGFFSGLEAGGGRKLTPKQVNLIRMKFRDKFGTEEGLLKALSDKTGDDGFKCLEDVPFGYMNILIKLCGGPWDSGNGWKK